MIEGIGKMTPNAHEKTEWSRMANAAYAARQNAIGHRYSVAASLPQGAAITTAQFDKLQNGYRAWLVFNTWVEG